MLPAMQHEGVADGPSIHLAAGDLTMELVPAIGGSVASFRKAGLDLMRPMSTPAKWKGDSAGAAMFSMLPYANRIADNCFDFEGRTYQFAPNAPGQRYNLHGTGWTSAWRAAEVNADSAELRLDRLAPGEPYAYSAYQRFKLSPDRLVVGLEISNCGERAMPFGFGLHPWWHRYPDVRLRFHAEHLWLEDFDHLATDRISVSPELDFSHGRSLPAIWCNNCYSGWDGIAEILFPDLKIGLRIEADPVFRHLMLYSDPSQPVFCLEPQTHAVGALNRIDVDSEDSEMIVLKPGECAKGEVSFVPISAEVQ